MAASVYSRSRRAGLAAPVAILLKHYPRLDEAELGRLIRLFRQLPMPEVALLTSDDRLGPKLAQFHADHGAAFAWSLRPGVVASILGLAILFGLLLYDGAVASLLGN